jgi:hypothetical protein
MNADEEDDSIHPFPFRNSSSKINLFPTASAEGSTGGVEF